MNSEEFKNYNFTVLGSGSKINGDLNLKGDIYIKCELEGTLSIEDESKIVFERGSSFKGNVYGHDIEIFGEVTGVIRANKTLTVRSSAKISGDIKAGNIIIYPGAVLNIDGHTAD